MKVLVIDIGGSNVKLMLSGKAARLKIPSGPAFTPARLVKQTLALTADWDFDVISIGFPAPVRNGKPVAPPNHLGRGWVGFDFAAHFKKPVKILNDASLQALGSYVGGRMLFLGVGTGLGSSLVLPDSVIPLELCGLRYSKKESLEDVLGKQALKRLGKTEWQLTLLEIVKLLKTAFLADDIVIGGGNAKFLTALPAGVRLGNNKAVLLGGERLWAVPKSSKPRKSAWLVA